MMMMSIAVFLLLQFLLKMRKGGSNSSAVYDCHLHLK